MSVLLEPVDAGGRADAQDERMEPRGAGQRPFGVSVRAVTRAIGLLAVAVTIVVLCLLDYPVLFGRWEFHSPLQLLRGSSAPINFGIRPAGFIADRSHQYTLLNLSFYTAELFGWDLTAFRLPVLVAGAVSVVVFFVVAGRAFGFWPGLVSAMALALNPTFLVFWHQLIVSIITMACLLLVVERYQLLERVGQGSRATRWVVLTLAVAFVLLLYHYGPGRFYGMTIIAFWAVQAGWRALEAHRAGRPIDRAPLIWLATFPVLVVLLMLLVDRRHVGFLMEPYLLLVTPKSEIVRSADQAGFVFDNVLIVLQALVPSLNLMPEAFSEHSADIIVDFRHYVLPGSMLPLVLLGVGVLYRQVRRSKDAQLTFWLLAVTLISPMFSSGSSISSYRLFYALIPLYLCAAAGAGWLLGHRSAIVRYGGIALCVAVLAGQVIAVRTEVERHQAFVDDLVRRWTPGIGLRIFEGDDARLALSLEDEWTNDLNGSYRHYIEGGGVPALVAAHQIKSRFAPPTDPSEIVVISLDGAVQRNDAAGPIKLVVFLRELGVSAALFDQDLQRIRGAGFERPTFVVAPNLASVNAARRQLEELGLRVRVREYKPPR